MTDDDDFGALTLPGFEPPPDPPEVVAGRVAGEIFRPWFKEYYEGRYTQAIPHIMKVLKKVVLDVVINGDTSQEDVVSAMAHIGKGQQVVTPLTLQYALARQGKIKTAKANAGMNADMADADEFQDFLMTGLNNEIDYGNTGQEF